MQIFSIFYIVSVAEQACMNIDGTSAIEQTIWTLTCDLQQFGILTSVDSDEPVQPPVKLRNSKGCSGSSLTLIEYSSD